MTKIYLVKLVYDRFYSIFFMIFLNTGKMLENKKYYLNQVRIK